MLQLSLPFRSESDPNKSPVTLPSLDSSIYLLNGKHRHPMNLDRFKPMTSSLNPYTVVPPIGAPMDEFKNYNLEVWETLRKIRADEKRLPEVDHQTTSKPVNLTANGEHEQHFINSAFEIEDIGSLVPSSTEKDIPEFIFLGESEHLGFTLPNISNFRYLTTPKRSLECKDCKTKEIKDNANPFAVTVIEPAYRTQGNDGQLKDGMTSFEDQIIDGLGYFSDCQEHTSLHPHECQVPLHVQDPSALFYWNNDQIQSYFGQEKYDQWLKRNQTAQAQEYYFKTGDVGGYMVDEEPQQWQNGDQTANAHHSYWDAGEIGYVEHENDKAWRQFNERLRGQGDPDDVETNDTEDENDNEEETYSVKQENKKPFLRLLMEKIRRKKKPAQPIHDMSPASLEQTFKSLAELQDLF